MTEIWKKAVYQLHPELVVDLEVSTLGNIRSIALGKIYKFSYSKEGYPEIRRRDYHIHIHKLVAQTFIGKYPPNSIIQHIDGNVKNNTLTNLKYTTLKKHLAHLKGIKEEKKRLQELENEKNKLR